MNVTDQLVAVCSALGAGDVVVLDATGGFEVFTGVPDDLRASLRSASGSARAVGDALLAVWTAQDRDGGAGSAAP